MKLICSTLILSIAWKVLAAPGGSDIGGGGNGTLLKEVSKSQIAVTLQNYQNHYSHLLTALEYTGLTAKRILTVLPKNPPELTTDQIETLRMQAEIYDVMFDPSKRLSPSVPPQIEMKEEDACYDRNNHPRDASVYAVPPFQICMSLTRLNQRLRQDTYEIELLALYLHEISHLFGTDENQATFIQKQILTMGTSHKEHWSFLYQKKVTQLERFFEIMNEYRQVTLSMNDNEKICDFLYQSNRKLQTLFVEMNVSTRNIFLWNIDDIIRFHTILVLASVSLDFCQSASFLSEERRNRFGKDEEVDLLRLYPDPLNLLSFLNPSARLAYSQFLLADLAKNIKVSRIRIDDKQTLISHLKKINSLSGEMHGPPL